MRRLIIGAAFVAGLLLLLTTAVAIANPPGLCDDPLSSHYNPDDTRCSTTTNPAAIPNCTSVMTVTGKARASFECLWTPADNGSTVATVTISNLSRGIKSLPTLIVRDDSPGDICVLAGAADQPWDSQAGANGPEYVASFDLHYADVPTDDVIDSPIDGVSDYSRWGGATYWDFILEPSMEPGTHWCAPQDFVLDSIRDDTNGGPLHLYFDFIASGYGEFEALLSPPPQQ